MASRIPQSPFADMVAWVRTTHGQYNAKSSYYLWHERNIRATEVTQSNGWGKIWKLSLPHKIKVFLWRVCGNTIPVRIRLHNRGVNVPTVCPICDKDIEHLIHIFFECDFARSCWRYVGRSYDMSAVECVSEWFLHKLISASLDELQMIVQVFWGIWFYRNKKVWEGKSVSCNLAMDWSLQFIQDWKGAKESRLKIQSPILSLVSHHPLRWVPPPGVNKFSIGLVLRDDKGVFLNGKVVCLSQVVNVLEAEVTAILEGLNWLVSLGCRRVIIESDSMLSVQVIHCDIDYQIEVGHTIDLFRELLHSHEGFSLSFVKRQANRVAHVMAHLPCLPNCLKIFMSPPTDILETLLYDSAF